MSGVNLTPDEVTAIIQLATLLTKEGVDVFASLRASGTQAGISKADLDAADAREQKNYADPLAK